jgi:hypothetical protein
MYVCISIDIGDTLELKLLFVAKITCVRRLENMYERGLPPVISEVFLIAKSFS